MESPQNIKKRLKSVNNINQITKAMELVSATKMRKSQQIALESRPYSFAALELLANLSIIENLKKEELPALFEVRKEVKRVLFVLSASDKGLAGAFNSSVFRKFEQHNKEYAERHKPDKSQGHFDGPASIPPPARNAVSIAAAGGKAGLGGEEHLYLAVGEKAYNYLSKRGFNVIKKFVHAGDHTTPEQVQPITDFIVNGYLNKDWDRVIIVSMHFRSALKQEPHVRRVLPVDFEHITDTITEIIPERGKFAELIEEHKISFVPDKNKLSEYLIEPAPKKVLEKLTKHLFFMQLYHLILEANASEHSARRMAMKTASDNAKELGEELNLQYNKSRQAAITEEITEISAGAEALS